MISNVCELSKDILELQQINASLVDAFAKKEQFYESEIKFLKENIRLLQDKLFGRKSEKIKSDSDERQLLLFDETAEDTLQDSDIEDTVEVPGYKRKKRGRRPLPANLPRIEVIHDLSDEEKICFCGCQKSCIGEEVSEQLDIIPASMQVIRNIRLKYVCKSCEGVENDEPAVSIAPVPAQLIPKSIATPGLLAHVMTAKFVDALPFYRQEKQFIRLGVDLSRATMCGWAMKVAEKCMPLLDILHDEILSGPLINIDETTLKVLNEPEQRSKSYMWIFRGGALGRPSLVYKYHATRAGDVAASYLRGYKGYVQTDGYSGYGFLDRWDGIHHVACWAHVRRKFVDVTKASSKKKRGQADKALTFIKKLYKIEKDARTRELTPEELYTERQEKAIPILESFRVWLNQKSIHTPPKGLLGKAISYAMNQWDGLVRYTEQGFTKPDNNDAENAIRPFVVGRKNWLFSGNPEGARASAALFSLIETAKANELEPYRYLRYLFEKLPVAESTKDFKSLLPQYLSPEQLKLNA
jgi:transposase